MDTFPEERQSLYRVGSARGEADCGGNWRGVATLGQSEIKESGRGRCDPFNQYFAVRPKTKYN